MEHSTEEYQSWGAEIASADVEEKWLNPDNDLDDVSLVARIIYAEEKDNIGQACVAQELHNRMRHWIYRDGQYMKYLEEPKYYHTWRGIIYASSQYNPAFDPQSGNGGPLHPASDCSDLNDPDNPWVHACDLAYVVVHVPLHEAKAISSATITDQMFHTGYAGRTDEIAEIMAKYEINQTDYPGGEITRHVWLTSTEPKDNRYNLVVAGQSIFFNDSNTVDNEIYYYGIQPNPPVGEIEDYTGFPITLASDFIDFLKSRVGCGYVLGTYGQICTQQLLENRSVADPNNEVADYLGNCTRWMGKLVTDCSGLIEWFLLKNGATNCNSYSGGMYRNWCIEKSADIKTMPRIPGTALFKRNSNGIYHVGIYVGRDRVIEAKGIMHGVVVTKYFDDSTWNAWGKFSWLMYNLQDYDVELLPLVEDALTYGPLQGYPDIRSYPSEEVSHSGNYTGPVYRKGDSGSKIEMIRRRFWAENSSFIVNELFDDALEAKLIEFQTANSLTPDGLVGSSTWNQLFPVLRKRVGSQYGVSEMQTLLNYQNYPVGTPDGLFGTGTETVLKAYQSARQLDSDGICGDNTWESLTLEEPFLDEVIIDQNGDYTAICSMGDCNDTVKQLQRRLALQYNLTVTGTYDAATNTCVIAYQNANGITANGNVGPITWKKLFPVLKMGRGTKDEVRALQQLLCYQKHGVLIDGLFGSGTNAAVKAYQTMRGLTSDGIVGSQTWTSLCITVPAEIPFLYFGTGGGNTSGSSSTIYRQGDNDAAVHQIKRRMAVENLFTGTVDSIFDAQLTYAVKQYQANVGTRIDGLVGPATWSLLFPIVKKQTGQQDGAKAVQALLNLNGYNVGTPDGLFGTGSETKLKEFQTAKGLTVDGICGAATWQNLCEI